MKTNTRKLATCGVLLAASFVLSFIKIGLPFGGSVTLFSMVPVIVAACLYGTKWGLLTSSCYALLQLFQSVLSSKSFVLDKWWQTALMIFLDFIAAFVVLGFSGIFIRPNRKGNVILRSALGTTTTVLIRYICHILSGAILFGTYAEWFFTEEFANVFGSWALKTFSGNGLSFVYSAVYNGLYMIPELIITVIGVAAVMKVVGKRNHKNIT